jgi:hypothetical protein
MEDVKPALIALPPWSLTGQGVVLLYRFSREFNEQYGFMEYYQSKGYIGGIGAMMLVEYQTTDVGPYIELLYIPGMFTIGGKLAFSISKIYVSTYVSAWNGKENWGIPKELADFSIVRRPNGEQVYEVEKNGSAFFEASLKPWGPQFPFSNKLLPLTRIGAFTSRFLTAYSCRCWVFPSSSATEAIGSAVGSGFPDDLSGCKTAIKGI